MEETGLTIKSGELMFVNEFMQPPLHAMELFFRVEITGGEIRLGYDPEMAESSQIITEVALMSFERIKAHPPDEVHRLFQYCNNIDDVFALRGYLYN